jgi:hypothetical protein
LRSRFPRRHSAPSLLLPAPPFVVDPVTPHRRRTPSSCAAPPPTSCLRCLPAPLLRLPSLLPPVPPLPLLILMMITVVLIDGSGCLQ